MNLRFEAKSLLGVGPAQAARDINAVTDLHSFYFGANAGDDTSGICSRSIRKLRLDGVRPAAHIRFKRIYTSCVNLDDNLPGAGPRLGNIFQFQLFRAAKLVNTNCFHHAGSRVYLRVVEAPRRYVSVLFSQS